LYFAAGASAVDLKPGLDRALKVAESVEAEALATLVVNRLRGILDCVAVKAPSRRRHGAGLRRPAPRPAGGHGDPQRGKNAVSVAGTLLLTEATLTEIREPEAANRGGELAAS